MFQVILDTAFGVKAVDNRSLIHVDTEPAKAPLFFKGFLVIVNEQCVRHIYNIKRWRRRGRPDKVRIRDFDQPTAYIANPPLVPRTTIICHPKIVERLEAAK